MKSLTRGARVGAHQIVSFAGWSIVTAQVLVIVLALLEGQFLRNQQVAPIVLWIIYGLHIMIGAYATVGVYQIRQFLALAKPGAIEEALDRSSSLQKDIDERTAQIRSLAEASAAVQGSLSVLQGLLKDETVMVATSDHFAKLLVPLIARRSEVLGYRADDLYNFAVYLFDEKAQELKIQFRQCDDRIERHDRVWRRGEGHVGVAFAQRSTVISSNVEGYRELLGSQALETDSLYYASFISAPIIDEVRKDPLGILAITSSRPDHLGNKYKVLVETLSNILSVFLTMCRSKSIGPQ